MLLLLCIQCLKKGQENVVLAKGYNELLQASVKFDLARILLLIASGIFNPKWIGLPINSANRTIIAQNSQLQAFTSSVIARKIKRISAEIEDGIEAGDREDREEIEDLVDVVIRTNLEMEKKSMDKHGKANTMSAKNLEGQIQLILFAGYETSSVTTVSRPLADAERAGTDDRVADAEHVYPLPCSKPSSAGSTAQRHQRAPRPGQCRERRHEADQIDVRRAPVTQAIAADELYQRDVACGPSSHSVAASCRRGLHCSPHHADPYARRKGNKVADSAPEG